MPHPDNQAEAIGESAVAVILCTFEGSRHVVEQLTSIELQDWPLQLFVFDDASTDNTLELVRSTNIASNCHIERRSLNHGFVKNFEHGIGTVLNQGHEYIALSDQDDLWHKNRISSGMRELKSLESRFGKDVPLLVHSDLVMMDADGNQTHPSFLSYRHYGINSSKNLAVVLGQNGVMGNTVLMNRALAELALPFPTGLHVHDYWLALLAELYGERRLLNTATVRYRIHEGNISNSANSIKFGLKKILDSLSWQSMIKRDLRLPFKEDSRLIVLEALRKGDGFRAPLNKTQSEVMDVFLDYLKFEKPRPRLLLNMFRHQFVRAGIRHRCRFIFNLLVTRRYPQ